MDKDIDSTYESLINIQQDEVLPWSSSAVYFDDEVVEYQGRHYTALTKTSAEVPGRSKPGIWKELDMNEEQMPMGLPEYNDSDLFSDPSPAINIDKKQQKNTIIQTQVPQAKTNLVRAQKEMTIKIPNKPLAKKKTLKERETEMQLSQKTINPEPGIMRKMQASPNEQMLVNTILKEMEFKKIKGFNSNDMDICKNLILPQTKDGAKLTWNSSHSDVISSKGEVTRPDNGHDIAVNLSLTVTINKTSATRFYTLWVKAVELVLSDEECVEVVYHELNFEHIKGQNDKASNITSHLELLTHGLHETQIFWASKNRNLVDETGEFFHDNLAKNTRLRLYAIISKGSEERLKSFDLILKK